MSDTPFPKARAAIFDLDGTLLDTLGDLADSVNAALVANGFPAHSEEAICSFIGHGAENLIRRALPEDSQSEAIASCLESFKDHYAKNFDQRTCPFPGVLETLAALREKGIPMGILSNKPHAFTLQCAAEYFGAVGETFGVVLGQREGVPQKPDPAGAIEAAATLGIPAAECLYIGDSDVDMQTAIAAGMVPIGVDWGFRPAAELVEAGAERVISTPGELLAAF